MLALLAEAEVPQRAREAGKREERDRGKWCRRAATQGKGGCISGATTHWGRGLEVGRGPQRTRLSLSLLGKPAVTKRRGDLEEKVAGDRTTTHSGVSYTL